MEPNPFRQELLKLRPDQVNYFLNAFWRRYPRVYLRLHRKHNAVGLDMIEDLDNTNPGLFARLIAQTLNNT